LLGRLLGVMVGRLVGLFVGRLVLLIMTVGTACSEYERLFFFRVGPLLGWTDGAELGRWVDGRFVGDLLGRRVVGLAVGTDDGTAVGA
jgi:hypothetical protein